MELIGFLLVVIALFMGYSSVNSFNPLRLGLAILAHPSTAGSLISGAKDLATSTEATVPVPTPVGTPQTTDPNLGTGHSSQAVTGYQAYAFSELASKYNITDQADKEALVKLWDRESGWNPNALNPSSGAFGIPQALPAGKIPGGRNASPQAQIDWGLEYIMQRYGSPSKAWAFETSHTPNWY